jgi:SAM-dependent methyltransferase
MALNGGPWSLESVSDERARKTRREAGSGLIIQKATAMKHHVCPVWVGHFLACPLRKLVHPPLKLLGPYVRPGMSVIDMGCAMGFFSLPLAQLVGENGRVVCVDIQDKMLQALTVRARRAGLMGRIQTRTGRVESLGLDDLSGQMDFALAFAVVHEISDSARFFKEMADVLKAGGRGLIAEPKGHVSGEDFGDMVLIAEKAGLRTLDVPKIPMSYAVLMVK